MQNRVNIENKTRRAEKTVWLCRALSSVCTSTKCVLGAAHLKINWQSLNAFQRTAESRKRRDEHESISNCSLALLKAVLLIN